ncbi:ABC1 kinase family protein [Actinomadura gamaensis]|uniref:ABC1 kinase family protein n=1 Tax=Actinomadura gamaensis TaxID=1763541 RepID=A0ABV9UB48_9ACTN
MDEGRVRLLVKVLAEVLGEEVRQRARLRGAPGGSAWLAEQWRPAAVRRAFEELGPFYTKVGQILSTRPDLVSEPVRQELGKLHDRVTPEPFERFAPVLEQELGDDWARRFADVETERPLGAASLAQVYRVTLRDRRPAVVKIQRPGIAPVIRRDMAVLRRATRLLSRCAPRFTGVMDLDAMLMVIFDAMRPELDFRLEAGNMDRARGIVARFSTLEVPEVLYAGPHVLIQSLAPGASIRDAKAGDFSPGERLAIGRDLLALMYRCYFVEHTFHADPHPGNIFVAPGERASIIDWGMVGSIDRRLSISIFRVLLGVVQNDAQAAARAWMEMGYATEWTEFRAFASDMAGVVPRVRTASLDELNFGVLLGTVLKRSTKRGIATSPMVSILAKSFANMEGSVRYLAPELSIIEVFQEEMSGILSFLATELFSEAQAARILTDVALGATTGLEQARGVLQDLSSRDLALDIRQMPPRSSLLNRLGPGAACVAAGAVLAHLLRGHRDARR